MGTRKTATAKKPVQSVIVRRGSGITARDVAMVPLNTPDGQPIKENIRAQRGTWTFDSAVRDVEGWARQIADGIKAPPVDDSPEDYAVRILQRIAMTRNALPDGQAAARWALEVGRLAEQARMKFNWGGRKIGSAKLLRKIVTNMRADDPSLKAKAIWARLAADPPKGYTFIEQSRLGKRIEGPTPDDDMLYDSFKVMCSRSRPKS